MEKEQQVVGNILSETGLVRLSQILGDKKKGIPPIIPISKSTWWAESRPAVILSLLSYLIAAHAGTLMISGR